MYIINDETTVTCNIKDIFTRMICIWKVTFANTEQHKLLLFLIIEGDIVDFNVMRCEIKLTQPATYRKFSSDEELSLKGTLHTMIALLTYIHMQYETTYSHKDGLFLTCSIWKNESITIHLHSRGSYI